MPMSSSLLKRGSALWENGEKNEARKIFEIIVHNDSHNEAAWVWYIDTRETNPEKIAAFDRYLAIFPQDESARKALAELREEQESLVRKGQNNIEDEKKKVIPPAGLVPTQEGRPVEKGWLQSLPWLFVAFGACFLLMSSFAFIARYNSLQNQVQKLETDRQSVLQNLAHLNTEYNTLQAEKNSLSDQYNSLMGQYENLNGQYSGLEGKYSNLNNNYSTLSERYDSLSAEHVSLQSYVTDLETRYNDTINEFTSYKKTAITPPYIYIRGRMVYLSFLTPSQEIYDWKVPFDQLESDLKRGNVERNWIKTDPDYPRLTLNNTITGEKYQIIDYREFVDPQIFTTFSTYFYNRAPSEEAFIYEIWYIAAQLTKYSGEITDTPRYPLETLLAGGGDCEDHAILFASMILAAAPPDWKVDLVYMDSDHPTEPQTVNHVIVYIKTANEKYTVEATGKNVMEPYGDNVTGWYFEISH